LESNLKGLKGKILDTGICTDYKYIHYLKKYNSVPFEEVVQRIHQKNHGFKQQIGLFCTKGHKSWIFSVENLEILLLQLLEIFERRESVQRLSTVSSTASIFPLKIRKMILGFCVLSKHEQLGYD
jgi:hypothetical protein